MTVQERAITVEQFEAFAQQPENTDKLFEFIAGEIVEVPSNPKSSRISIRIARYLDAHVDDNELGHVTGEQGGYMVFGERYAPDVAYISFERQPELAEKGYNPNPPELAVEVVSSDSKAENEKLTIKLGNYLAAGTLVWIVRPEAAAVEVYAPGQPVQTLGKANTLTGGDVLPDFAVELTKIFK